MVAIDSGDHMRALTLTRVALGDLDAEAEPLRAARLLLRRAKLLRNAGKSDGSAECDEAHRLLGLAPQGPGRVRLLADLAHIYSGIDAERATEFAREAKEAAADEGDLATLVAAEVVFGEVCAGRMSPAEALPTMYAAAERARAAGDLSSLSHSLVNISDSLYELGRYEESAATAAEGVPDADRVGVSRTTGVFLLANHAEALLALGRWDEADARLAEAARHDPPGRLALPWLRLRAWLRLARGVDGAAALVNEAAMWLGKPYLQAENRLYLLDLKLLLTLESGDPIAAAQLARKAVEEPCVFERPRYSWPLLATAARAAVAAPGGEDLAAAIDDVAGRLTRAHPAERAFAAQVAAVLHGGEQRWQAAVDAWRLDGRRYELAAALLGLAEAQAASRGVAAETLSEVNTIADELGAAPLLEAADTLARRLGLRTPGAAAMVAAGTEVLTAREREVLRLVAEGHGNQEIAERLTLSVKTVEAHKAHIMRKLNVKGRTELIKYAIRKGLIEP